MLEFHASLGFKAKKMGIGRPYIEGRTGDSFLFKTGKWMFLSGSLTAREIGTKN